ncbi:hypothetical protein D3C85_1632910 [compost metagenome]
MPDIDHGTDDRQAGHGVDDPQAQHQGNAIGAFADVAPDQFRIAKIRAGDLLGRQQVNRV